MTSPSTSCVSVHSAETQAHLDTAEKHLSQCFHAQIATGASTATALASAQRDRAYVLAMDNASNHSGLVTSDMKSFFMQKQEERISNKVVQDHETRTAAAK